MLAAIITDIIVTHHSAIDTAKTLQTNWSNSVVVLDRRMLGWFLASIKCYVIVNLCQKPKYNFWHITATYLSLAPYYLELLIE